MSAAGSLLSSPSIAGVPGMASGGTASTGDFNVSGGGAISGSMDKWALYAGLGLAALAVILALKK